MESNVWKRIVTRPYVMLMIISIVMSFAIAGVYSATKDTIEAAAAEARAAARKAVMDGAASMEELPLSEEAPVDYVFEAYDQQGNIIGLVSQITVVGFGGEIEVTVGLDADGSITSISVGGAHFSETSGLGAKTREPAFTEQFRGKSGMLVLKQNIDSVTGASISSGAVVSGVNKAVEYMKTFLPQDALPSETEELPLSDEQIAVLLPGTQNIEWMGGAAGIDGWWLADNGYIVRATGFGEGPIVVMMGFDPDGTVQGVIIGDELFMETPGRGDRILEDWYAAQFIGRSGVQSYGEGIDAISGATVTSNAALSAINACMGFDPAMPGRPEPVPASSTEASSEPDAVSEATVPEETEPLPTQEMPTEEVPDAVSEATVPEETPETETPEASSMPDAVTEATAPEEDPAIQTPEPLPTPDAMSEASIPADDSPSDGAGAPRITIWVIPGQTAAPDAETGASEKGA